MRRARRRPRRWLSAQNGSSVSGSELRLRSALRFGASRDFRARGLMICPTGGLANFVSGARAKNISLPRLVEKDLLIPLSRPTEGRIAIVTDAGRDAVSRPKSAVTFAAAERSGVLSSGADEGVLPHRGAQLRWVFTCSQFRN